MISVGAPQFAGRAPCDREDFWNRSADVPRLGKAIQRNGVVSGSRPRHGIVGDVNKQRAGACCVPLGELRVRGFGNLIGGLACSGLAPV